MLGLLQLRQGRLDAEGRGCCEGRCCWRLQKPGSGRRGGGLWGWRRAAPVRADARRAGRAAAPRRLRVRPRGGGTEERVCGLVPCGRCVQRHQREGAAQLHGPVCDNQWQVRRRLRRRRLGGLPGGNHCWWQRQRRLRRRGGRWCLPLHGSSRLRLGRGGRNCACRCLLSLLPHGWQCVPDRRVVRSKGVAFSLARRRPGRPADAVS